MNPHPPPLFKLVILHVHDRLELYLTPQMEEVVQIVGAEISCAALGDVRVQRRGVRLGSGRIKCTPLAVLQRHVYPVEQLRGSVRGDPRFHGRHHVASLRAASFGTAPSETLGFWDAPASYRHPPRCCGVDAMREFTAGSLPGPQ